MERQDHEKLYIRMLGEFSICRGDSEIVKKGNRSKKIWLLIGILLTERGKYLSQNQLIELLWRNGDECIDPANSLKNLVYRARMLLEDLNGDEDTEYIRYAQGAYAWNTDIPCELDTDTMVLLSNYGRDDSETLESRIARYAQAISLYRGEFLPNLAEEEWIFSKRGYYESLYVNCVLRLCRLYNETEQYNLIIPVCEQAIQHCPFQEDIHRVLLKAYVSTDQNAKALVHYESMAESFNRELGVGLSNSIRMVYEEILKGIHSVETDLFEIKRELLKSDGDGNRAFFCEFPVFREICRVQMRMQERSGQEEILVLLTVIDKNGECPPLEKVKNVMEILKDCILDTLRRNDIVARFSPSQFILGLAVTSKDNAQIISERIHSVFESRYRRKEIHLTEQVVSLRQD